MDSIEHTRQIFLGNYHTHDKLYFSSNEDLYQLLDHVKLTNKKVLSVLASSDQYFHLSEHDPRIIDTFDINHLTKYYFYLRKWGILYHDDYYPNVFSNEAIYSILKEVKPRDEKEENALDYWMRYIQTFYPYLTKELVYLGEKPKKNQIKDLRRLKEYLLNQEFRFYHMDISKDVIDDKYDFIYISNIPEYYILDEKAMSGLSHNLYQMLEDDGEVLLSYVIEPRSSIMEIKCFNNFLVSSSLLDKRGERIGKIYKKIMSTKNS